LRTVASLPIATPEECFGYLSLLKSLGHIGPSDRVMLWNGEEQREVIIAGTEIYREPKESGLPPDLELDKQPDYLFARCSLAQSLIQRGEFDDAERLLAGQFEHDRLHIQEVFRLWGVMAMLHSARGEDEKARSLLSSLGGMVEDDADARHMARVERAVDRVRAA
jgi:hypothetical protein